MPKRKYTIRVGERYGRLLVIGPRVVNDGRSRWTCACDCGRTALVAPAHLVVSTRSCGCLAGKGKHGESGRTSTPTYISWKSMRERSAHTKRYVDMGVVVCERWRGPDGYVNFLADMGPRPSKDHSIDRYPDPTGNYEPTNCRWATPVEQCRNKVRPNVRLVVGGEELPLVVWAERVGVSADTIQHRLRRGWSAERAVSPIPQRSKEAS